MKVSLREELLLQSTNVFKLATWKRIGLLAIVSFIGVLGFGWAMQQYSNFEPSIVDFQLAWTKERALSILNKWGNATKNAIGQTWFDFGFLVSYSAFGVAATLFSMRYVNKFQTDAEMSDKWRNYSLNLSLLTLIACVLTGVCDACENIVMLSIMYQYNDANTSFTSATVFLYSIFAFFKWFIFGAIVLLFNFIIAPVLAAVAACMKTSRENIADVEDA